MIDHSVSPTTQAEATSPTCPHCGYVMCQQFDDKPITALASLAIPNGSYMCYRCGRTTVPMSEEGAA